MNGSGTVDITNVVESLRTAFVDWATTYVFELVVAVPALTWVALPVISSVAKAIIGGVINFLTQSEVMAAFFINSALKNAGQAQDFVDAVNKKQALPPTATDQEYKDAEQAQMLAFHNFVMLSN